MTHIYRQPFKRGSDYVNLRPAEEIASPEAGSVVIMSRVSGYYAVGDTVLFDAVRPTFSDDPVPNISAVTLRTPFEEATHTARFRTDTIAVRNWPKGQVAVAEFID